MKAVLCIIALLCVSLLPAQDPYGIPITKRNGLPSNEIYSILQDSKGFIWMGTGAGLCRYDGFVFQTYPLSLQRPPAGSCLREDQYGRIWYTTFDGWLHYVQNDSLFTLPKQRQPAGSLEYALTKNSIIVPANNGVDVYDLKTLEIKKSVRLKFQFLVNSTQYFDNLCLIADSLYVVSPEGELTTYPLPVSPKAGSIVSSPNGDLLLLPRITGPKKAYRFNGKFFEEAFELPQSFIHSEEFCDNRFWFFTDQGIFIYTADGTPINKDQPLFQKELMTCMMKDRQNNYWFGSKDNAMLLVHDFDQQLLLKDNVPVQMEIMHDTLYCAIRSGGGVFMPLPPLGNVQPMPVMNAQAIYMLKCDTASGLIFYTHSQGFLALRNGKPVITRDAAIKGIASLSKSYAVYAGSGFNGMMRIGNEPDPIWDYCFGKYPTTKEGSYEVTRMTGNLRGRDVAVTENRQQAWIATNQGIFQITPAGMREVKHNNESIVCRKIRAIKNMLYGLTVNGDLICIGSNLKMEKLSGRFQVPGQIEQLYSFGSILIMVRAGTLIILDVNKYGKGTTIIKTNASDIFDVEYYQSKIMLATPEGLLMLKYTPGITEVSNPPFIINSIFANGIRTNTKQLMELGSDQQEIDISYSILSYSPVSITELYYRLNNREWVKCDPGSRILKLAGLASGVYILEFRYGNENGPTISTIRFKIAPKWWQHPVTYIVASVIGILLIFFGYRYLLKAQEKKNREITERLELERNFDRSVLTAIRSQMNPHFFFNALNTIQSYIFENDRQNAGNYLSKFSKLTRMVLEMSGRDVVTLSEETDALQLYLELEKARFTEDFSFELKFDENVDKELIRIPPMLLQPYVENAVKHGLLHKKGKKKLTLRFSREQQLLIVEINDNGIGRKRSMELNRIRSEHHESFSSEANQKRLELLNKGRTNKLGVEYVDKTDDHGHPSGTTVTITIPI
ncbi:MAG: histidine kinase [Bacteroidia bacterium]|jgi:two-component sensor histidine kinase|nr:histidine kinase [Bacteroidia bacterium]